MKNFAIAPVLIALILGGFLGAMITNQNKDLVEMDHSNMMVNEEKTDHSEMDMNHMMEDMMKNLEGKTGDELDEAFLKDMIPHHQGAVEMAEVLLEGTEREEMKKFANDIINAQSGEIEVMEQWLEDWFGNNS